LLLPDGRVLLTGSGEGGGGFDQKTYEVYSPPYLFKGPRPTITAAPSGVAYGEAFQVQSPEAGSITKVTFIRLGSVTHAFDESQRLLSLSYTVSGNALTVSAPANGNLAPPGHYLLSLVNGEGVPSVSKIIQIR
jgi:galactose oxidase